MPQIVYEHDRSSQARLKAVELGLQQLRVGPLLTSNSVQVRAAAALTGAWPQSVSFAVANANATVLIVWQVTAFNAVAGSATTVNLNIDSVLKDSSTLYINIASTHMTFPFGVVALTGLTVASHSAQVALTSGTSDGNDHGHILILELP